MMRVILTVIYSPWSPYSGGAQRSTHILASALAEQGLDVTVVYTRAPGERYSVPETLPYTITWAPFWDYRSRRNAPLRSLTALSVKRTVARLLRQSNTRSTIVHSHAEEGGLLQQLRKQFSFGWIATVRFPWFPEVLFNPSPSFLEQARLLLQENRYILQGWAARYADRCVTPSQYIGHQVQQAFHVAPERLRIIPNSVPPVYLKYHYEKAYLSKGPIVFFGRFDPTKGLDLLIKALAVLPDFPGALFIGRGPQKSTLQQLAHQLNIAHKIRWLDWQPEEAVARYISRASMVVLPSRQENFSLALLGALAVGAPVISTAVGGTPEIITHQKHGLLVPSDDVHALSEAMQQLLTHPEWAYTLAKAGKTHVRTHFTPQTIAQQYLALYREVLS